MEDNKAVIAILADKSRFSYLENILRENGFSADDGVKLVHLDGFSTRFDWRRTLARFERAGVHAIIIDDDSFADADAMTAGIGYFQVACKNAAKSLRIIFVGSEDRGASDDVFVRLASSGVYDLVIPARDDDVAGRLCELLRQPACREDVASLIIMTPVYDGAVAPAPVDEPLTRSEQVRIAARGKSVIAVAGIMPRSGATNCSIVLARHLVMLGQTPALVVDKRTGAGFQKGYRFAMASDGKSFRVNGVDIFPGDSASIVPRRYTHVVIDIGYLSWGLQSASAEEQQKVIEFNKADLQVVYLPCSSPADFEYLNRFFESRTRADLERYAIGVWGATSELFDMIRTRFREKAPEVFMWNVDVYRWPLSLGQVTPDIAEVLRPVLPRGVAEQAIAEAAAKAGKAEAVGDSEIARSNNASAEVFQGENAKPTKASVGARARASSVWKAR